MICLSCLSRIKSLHVQLDEKKAKLRSMQNPHEHEEEIPEPDWSSSTTFMHSTFMHTKDLARDVTRDSTGMQQQKNSDGLFWMFAFPTKFLLFSQLRPLSVKKTLMEPKPIVELHTF